MTTKRAGKMPAHVQATLIADGVMSEDRLTRTAKPRRCPTCRQMILAAIDDLGFDAWADPRPVTPLGELQALTSGRRTWSHTMGGLDARDAPFIAYLPADRLDVHGEHRCGAPPVQTRPPPPTPLTSADIRPPF